jgi:pyruvate dehydrogenase E2 component (dihydrolipoamide acetyltransferase)
MATEVVMPRLGWTMEVGRVVEWLKNDGDPVEEGEIILAIESDKAVNEVEALDSGILRIPADPQIGIELPVGAPLGFIVHVGDPDPFAGAPPSGAVNNAQPAPLVETGVTAPAVTTAVATAVGANGHARKIAISPRARRTADRLGIDPASVPGTGSTGRVRERDILAVAAARPPQEPMRAAPSVRRLAEENGVDLRTVAAGRPGGRITRSDVLGNAAQAPRQPAATNPIGPIRRVLIERMTEAARTVAPVTLTTDVDATELVRTRESFKDEMAGGSDPTPSYNDIVIRLVALALVEHPDLNASLTGEGIVQHEAVHVGLAVDTDRSLLVPVVRDADRKSVHQIAADTANLISAAQAGTAPAESLKGSTFTVTNLGMYGIDAFTPIINLPECAILGLGRIESRAVVVNDDTGEIAARKMMALSLTFDHRVVDGAPAARFLQGLSRKIERPFIWLTR